MTIFSKSPLEENCSKVIFFTIEICRIAAPVIYFVVVELVPLRVEMNLGHAHKTRFWYL